MAKASSYRKLARSPQGSISAAWIALPTTALYLTCFVLPFVVMIFVALSSADGSRSNLERVSQDGFYLSVTMATFRLGLEVTLGSLLVGYPLAHLIARTSSRRLQGGLFAIVMMTMMTGIVVRTFAWIALLRDQGVVNSLLLRFGAIVHPLPLMYNEFGTVVALIHIYVPFMVFTLVGVIARIDVRAEEAARLHGATPFRAFIEVTLPLSLPGIAAGSLLVFALAISAYVTPALMGGSKVLTLPMLIYQSVSSNYDLKFGSFLGGVLMLLSFVVLLAYNKLLSRMSKAY